MSGKDAPEYSVVRKAAHHGGTPIKPGLACGLPSEWVYLHQLKPGDPLTVEVGREFLVIRPAKGAPA